jgi:aquaporin Z
MGRRGLFSLQPLPRFAQACFAEFLGTYFFVLIIAGALAHAGAFAPIAIGFALTFLVYAYGYVSKAQLNPAVSFGLWCSGIQDLKCTLTFVVVQLCAGLLGAVTALGLMVDTENFPTLKPYSDSGMAQARAFFVELLFTLALAQTMINVAVSRQEGNSHFGIAIGLSVLCAAFAFGPVSGVAINPAVTLGLQVVQLYSNNHTGRRPITYIWLYWLAQFVGGAFAGMLFRMFDESDAKPESPKSFGDAEAASGGAEPTSA